MDNLSNPFSPGAGSQPPELAGREALLDQARLIVGRLKAGKHEQSLMLVGLRGVGKTVLLNRIRELAVDAGFGVAMVEATENKSLPALLVPELRRTLYQLNSAAAVNQQVRRAFRVLASFVSGLKVKVADIEVGLDIEPEKGTADSGDLEADLAELFLAIGEAAAAKGAAVAVIVDEIQYLREQEMSALIMATHRAAQRQVPIIVISAGLPQLVGLAGRSKSYAERLFQFPEVGPLTRRAAAEALTGPLGRQRVSITAAALDRIYEATAGYPYFIQEWGYHAWNLAAQSPIDDEVVRHANDAAIKKLDGSFFRVRFDRLTPREKDYMRALAQLGTGAHRSGGIAEILGVNVKSIAPLRSGLIRKGMIYSPSYGDTAFTVPLFEAFMIRSMPDWAP